MGKVFVVNKPVGKTSYQVVREFKKKFPGQKVGHAGTLDPLASGVLIVLIGRQATKRQAQFMALEKEYLVEVVFGLVTETWDLEKDPWLWPKENLAEELRHLSQKKLEKVLTSFQGSFNQIIPAFSAVKVNGRRLYKTARSQGVEIADLPTRTVTIKQISLKNFSSAFLKEKRLTVKMVLENGPKAKISMIVTKGTYVRSLVYQLGLALDTGAVTTSLHRVRIGPYRAEEETYQVCLT